MRKHISIIILALIGLGLCTGNVAIACWRTAVPLQLGGVVTALRIAPEKHSGVDDVLLVSIDDGRAFQIERELYDQLTVGDRIEKAAWSRSLLINGAPASIAWSADLKGMLVLMPTLAVALIGLAVRSARATRTLRR